MKCHFSIHYYFASLLSTLNDKLSLQFHMLAIINKEKTLQQYYRPTCPILYEQWLQQLKIEFEEFFTSACNVYNIQEMMEIIVNKYITHHPLFLIGDSNSHTA